MNRAAAEPNDELVADVVNALGDASIDELIEIFNQLGDAPDYVYPMYAFDDVFSELAPNATPFEFVTLASAQGNSFNTDDEYFRCDGIVSPYGVLESFDGNGTIDYLMAYIEEIARAVIELDNPTAIQSVEDVLYPEE